MTYKMSRLMAQNERFVHYTYLWSLADIQKDGIRQSLDGMMGPGIYCCRFGDEKTCQEIVEFLTEEINWADVAARYPEAQHTREVAKSLIHPVYFEHTGQYMLGEENTGGYSDIAGHVVIPQYAILPNKLIIGCPVDSGIEPQFMEVGRMIRKSVPLSTPAARLTSEMLPPMDMGIYKETPENEAVCTLHDLYEDGYTHLQKSYEHTTAIVDYVRHFLREREIQYTVIPRGDAMEIYLIE
ncbi:hypothetical protein [Cohnella sp. AR92]|uniref:hypothetical protein n=1 Tax=Cohnella sp. AR92 TaxID=648716 RepID=UPI000F8ED8B2|nr:hypothetical protein [Cohnella sp. AR92]RUS44919.1 hypothetical protein ELR57_21935 [Cohnella sp. AR92]